MDGSLTLLSGLRVVEVAGRYSGRVAGWLLAALGADVIRVSCVGPEVEEFPSGGSGSSLAWDRRKRTVAVGAGDRPAELHRLLAETDVLITSGENAGLADPPVERRFGLDFSGVQVDLSPYGTTGPCRDWRATDLTIGAHAGFAAYVGAPGRAPLVPPVQLVSHQAGLAAATGALAALGRWPRTVEVAEFDVMATTHMVGLYSLAFFSGSIPRRAGRRKPAPYPFTHLPCADGWVCIAFLEGRHWARFVEAMGSPTWAGEERYRDRRRMGEQYPDEVDALVTSWLETKTKAELLEMALERGIPLAPLRTLDELLGSDQLAARDFFEPVEANGCTIRLPRLPFRVALGRRVRRAVRGATHPSKGGETAGPLAGTRVLDLGRVASAPAVGQWLADLGAEVIKVESRTHLDSARKGRPLIATDVGAGDAGQTPNLMPFFLSLNRGKRSLVLDLGNEAGRSVLRRLVEHSDVLVENFGAGGLERFGLGPDVLHAARPDLVIVRVSAVGQEGPESSLPGYAPHSTAAAGLDAVTGYAGAEPVGMIASNFGDLNTAAYGTLATLSALRAGGGVTIDVSMLEANACHLAPALVDHQTGTGPTDPGVAAGNGHATYAPHEVLRCAGDDEWLAVAARTDEERRALAAVVAADGGESLDEWAGARRSAEAAELLQDAGVPAAPVLGAEDLLFDDHVREREVVVEIPHQVLGAVPVHGPPVRSPGIERDGSFMAARGPAPDLGEHTLEILRELGFDDGEISDLEATGALDR